MALSWIVESAFHRDLTATPYSESIGIYSMVYRLGQNCPCERWLDPGHGQVFVLHLQDRRFISFLQAALKDSEAKLIV